jgi:capsular polysaccharide export protein
VGFAAVAMTQQAQSLPMLGDGIHGFKDKNVLLLQGPVGPFFARLAEDLRSVGACVHKVNFNAGDWLFYRRDAIPFDQPMQAWPAFFSDLIDRLQIDVVLLFGDCRRIHTQAHAIAKAKGLEVGVFEEGYLRPHYITLERDGVNGNSQQPRTPLYFLNQPKLPHVPYREIENTYWPMVWWGFCYFGMGALGKPFFPYYEHHRKLSWTEAFPWIRSLWRKRWYQWHERHALPKILKRWDRRIFLVPLQVHNDAQIQVHSRYPNIEAFIDEVMDSFAQHAPPDVALVIKHHPMDRGYTHYGRHIDTRKRQLGLQDRCFYLHDQHMPTLLDHARGVVVINSTVGLQALRHRVPTKALGEALYNMQGLCHQGELSAFWQEAGTAHPLPELLEQFVSYLKNTNQVNGSFYRAAPTSGWRTGVFWPDRTLRVADISDPRSTAVSASDHRQQPD